MKLFFFSDDSLTVHDLRDWIEYMESYDIMQASHGTYQLNDCASMNIFRDRRLEDTPPFVPPRLLAASHDYLLPRHNKEKHPLVLSTLL